MAGVTHNETPGTVCVCLHTLSKDELGKNLIYTCSFEKMTDNAYALP